MKTLFITNSRSGKPRNHLQLHALIERHYGESSRDFSIESCTAKEHLDELIASAIRNRVDLVFAVGGDGTVNEVARRLIGTSLVLGIIPVGSGNGLARHLGIPLDVTEALRAAMVGEITTMDTGSVNGLPFLGVAGVGFDALIAERFASSSVRGLQTYVKESLRSIGSYRAENYTVTVDGQALQTAAFLVTVANSNQYGNDVRIAPLASLQDGLFDVTIVVDAPLTAAPMILGKLLMGEIHQSSHVISLRGSSVSILRSSPGAAHVDGEPIRLAETLHFTMHPASLRILVPPHGRRL